MEVETTIEAGTQNPVMELYNIAEVSRQLPAPISTLTRKIAEHNVQPDAVLILGSTRRRSPLFVPGRLEELRGILPR